MGMKLNTGEDCMEARDEVATIHVGGKAMGIALVLGGGLACGLVRDARVNPIEEKEGEIQWECRPTEG